MDGGRDDPGHLEDDQGHFAPPYLDLNTEYYDLGLENRDKTNDQVTIDSAEATKKYGVAVKCATITPNAARMDGVPPPRDVEVPQRHHPGHSGRHGVPGAHPGEGHHPLHPQLEEAYHHRPPRLRRRVQERGGPGAPGRQAELLVTKADGTEEKYPIHEFTESGGIIQGLHKQKKNNYNSLTNKSIQSFARACFNYALDTNQDLWFATKDTISKKYDHRFKDIFQEIYDSEYAKKFQEAGIEYFYTLIDDAVARVVRSEGGYIWACKNYDGDVMSDMVATAFGSLAMMTSVLVSPDGTCEYEAAHGTVQRTTTST